MMDRHFAEPEALNWLSSNKNPSALASNRFNSTEDALRFVQKLYTLGAVKITEIENEGFDVEGDHGDFVFLWWD